MSEVVKPTDLVPFLTGPDSPKFIVVDTEGSGGIV